MSDDEVHTLIQLGLTSCQARVYSALSRSNSIGAKEISLRSGVTREDVYRIMPKLQEIGLVEIILGNPNKYKAQSLRKTVTILLKRRNSETLRLKTKTQELIKKAPIHSELHPSLEYDKFVIVPSSEVLIKKIGNAIDKTKKQIDIITSFRRLQTISDIFINKFERLLKKGISIRVIIEEDNKDNFQSVSVSALWRKAPAEIRYILGFSGTVMTIYDKKEVFIFTKPSLNLNESPALWSNASCLISLAQNNFETIWKKAKVRRIEL